jgi:hypothetical protein
MTRDHHTTGQPPQFAQCAQEFKHLDGSRSSWRTARPADAKAKANDRAFRRALRNYRKYVIPMAETGHKVMESWLTLAIAGAAFVAVLLWQAGVFGP